MMKKWTYDDCFNEAKKYTSKNEFRKNSSSACNVSYTNGWIKDYIWFVGGKRNLDKDYCIKIASQYDTINIKSNNDIIKNNKVLHV